MLLAFTFLHREVVSWFYCSGTQNLLQLLSKRYQVPLKLAADLDPWCWFCTECRLQELQAHGSFNPDFKGRSDRVGCVEESGSLQAAPERVVCDAVKMSPKLQWSSHSV